MPIHKIVWEGHEKDSPQNDKKLVEALIKSLNQKIQKDPNLSIKAAKILENWLLEKSKS
jgi:hypothetical protein